MFDPSFRADFDDWRRGRPEWEALIRAVAAGQPAEKLAALAESAGASADELRQLVLIRRNAVAKRTEAAGYREAKARLDQLDAEIERLKKLADVAEIASDRHAARCQLQELVVQRDRHFRGDFLTTESAHNYISQVAEPAGLA